jgi:hypothetical protein
VGGAHEDAVLGLNRYGVSAAGQANPLSDRGGDADLGELPVMARNEHDALVIADGGRERDAHAGKDNGVIEGDQSKRTHRYQLPIYLQKRSKCSTVTT